MTSSQIGLPSMLEIVTVSLVPFSTLFQRNQTKMMKLDNLLTQAQFQFMEHRIMILDPLLKATQSLKEISPLRTDLQNNWLWKFSMSHISMKWNLSLSLEMQAKLEVATMEHDPILISPNTKEARECLLHWNQETILLRSWLNYQPLSMTKSTYSLNSMNFSSTS